MIHVTGATARVFLGTLLGQTSPVRTFTPLLGAEITLDAGAHLTVGVDTGFEHGVLADTDGVSLEGVPVPRAGLGFIGLGLHTLTLRNDADEPGRLVLLGGTPFEEDILMVELRRPLPRRDRAVSPGVAGRGRAVRPGRGL